MRKNPSKLQTKFLRTKKMRKWYFVTKIVLTYCEKKLFYDRKKLLKFEAEEREFAKMLRSLELNFLLFLLKQAWKLSAIKGKPNLSILWDVRIFNQIWQKDISSQRAISVQKASSNLTKVFLAKKHFLQNSNFCQKYISGKKNKFLSEKLF